MEFQDFIQQTDNYLQVCKDLKLHVSKNKGYAIIKTYRDNEYDYETYPWMRYCRGIIINTDTNRVVCVPPKKSIELSSVEDCYFSDKQTEYTALLDGTMINLFYDGNEWIPCTRSSIGAKTKWDGKRTFASLFKESSPQTDWKQHLQTDHSYSFVLVHKQNRIVSPVNENGIFLVEQYKLGETIEKVPLDTFEGVHNVISFDSDYLDNYKDPELYFSIKGFSVFVDGKRYKWINPMYSYVEKFKMNHNHKLMNYISLRQKRILRDYLFYFPEDSKLMNDYRDDYNTIKDRIFNSYLSRFVYKNKTMEEIDFPLRPIIYELHKHYLETKEKTTIKVVSDYLHKMDGKRITFIHNYLFT